MKVGFGYGLVCAGALLLQPGCDSEGHSFETGDESESGSDGEGGAMSGASGLGGTAATANASGEVNAGNGGTSAGGSAGGEQDPSGGAADSGAPGIGGNSGDAGTGASAGSGGGGAGTSDDNLPPVPGKSGALSFTGVTLPRTTVSWTAATDDLTPGPALRYRVYRSLENNVGSATNALLNGTPVSALLTGATEATIALVGGVENFVNVVVWDESDAPASYMVLPIAAPTHCEQHADCSDGTCNAYFRDLDGDEYGASNTQIRRCTNVAPAGYVTAGGDCCDLATEELSDSIHPGQTRYFVAPANICGITYDYDCDGIAALQYPTPVACDPVSCTRNAGFWHESSMPPCGGTAPYPSCGLRDGPGTPCVFNPGAPSGILFQGCH